MDSEGKGTNRSSTVEAGFPFLEKGPRSFLEVVRAAAFTEEAGLQVHSFIDGQIESATGRHQRLAKGDRALGQHLRQHLFRLRHQLGRLDDMIDQAESFGGLGVDHIAGEVVFNGPPLADQTGKPLRSTEAGDDAKIDFRLTESGLRAGDPDMTGHCKLASATQGESVHGGDHGAIKTFNRQEGMLTTVRILSAGISVKGIQLGDIGAGGERLFPRSRDDHAPNRFVSRHVGDHSVQFGKELDVQCIELVRTIERYGQVSRLMPVDKKGFVGHVLKDEKGAPREGR